MCIRHRSSLRDATDCALANDTWAAAPCRDRLYWTLRFIRPVERRPQTAGSVGGAAPAPSVSSSRDHSHHRSGRQPHRLVAHRDHRPRSPSFGSLGSSSFNSSYSGVPQPPYPIPTRSSSKHVNSHNFCTLSNDWPATFGLHATSSLSPGRLQIPSALLNVDEKYISSTVIPLPAQEATQTTRSRVRRTPQCSAS